MGRRALKISGPRTAASALTHRDERRARSWADTRKEPSTREQEDQRAGAAYERTHSLADVGLEDGRLVELFVPVRGEPDLAQRTLLRKDDLGVEHPGKRRERAVRRVVSRATSDFEWVYLSNW